MLLERLHHILFLFMKETQLWSTKVGLYLEKDRNVFTFSNK